jgi:hypothetical protein
MRPGSGASAPRCSSARFRSARWGS